MARDRNPNKVTPDQVDEVFLTQAKQVEEVHAKKRPNKYLARTQSERDRDLAKAKKIVEEAKKKKK